MLNSKATLATRLDSLIKNEDHSSVNYIIASYIMENFEKLKHCSSTDLAKQCNVSKASISRFCRKIGLEDYFDLKLLINNYNNKDILKEKYSFQSTNEDSAGEFLQLLQSKIATMADNLDRNVLKQLVEDIDNHEDIYLLGSQQSMAIAAYLQTNLLSCKKLTNCLSNYLDQKDLLLNAKKDKLIIVFSATGAFFERVLRNVKLLERKDRPIIYLITNNRVEYSFLKQAICLGEKYDFVSNDLLYVYASLITIEYRKLNLENE